MPFHTMALREREILEHAVHTVADLLIDCEEDRTLRAVLVGMLPGSGSGTLMAHREPAPHDEPAV